MKIHDISIENFRGIRRLERLRCGSFNSFVGKNDSGKSAIIHALNVFFNEKPFCADDVNHAISDNEKVTINVRFLPSEPVSDRALDTEGCLSVIKTFSFTDKGKPLIATEYVCSDIQDAAFHNIWNKAEDDINDLMTKLDLPLKRSGRGIKNVDKIEEISGKFDVFENRRHDLENLLTNLKKAYPSAALPEFHLFDADQNLDVSATDFQSKFKSIAADALNSLDTDKRKIQGAVEEYLAKEFGEIAIFMQRNVPELELIKPNAICNWGTLVKFDLSLKFKGDAKEVPLSHRGTGFRRLLMVAYFEYFAHKSKSENRIYAIEEPETYLHPDLQYDLLESIKALSDDNQFFITTHSPVFAGATKHTNIVIVKKDATGMSLYKNHQTNGAILDQVINELGIRPSFNLLNDDYRKVVFVEGSGDVKFWQIALQKLNGGVPPDILFIPCGGDQVGFFVNASLCKRINRHFLVILDSDSGAVDFASKEAKQNDIKSKVAAMDGGFATLRKREIENYYHVDAMRRLLAAKGAVLPQTFAISEYEDVKELIKREILGPLNVGFKAKNNIDVFEEMTAAEWRASSAAHNGSTDVEIIISSILE